MISLLFVGLALSVLGTPCEGNRNGGNIPDTSFNEHGMSWLLTHGQDDPAAIGFEPIPLRLNFSSMPLTWTSIDGTPCPPFLNGTFYRGAPGQWPDGYWLDGLITLNAFRIEDGRVTYSMRYCEDDAYNASFSASDGGAPSSSSEGTIPHPANSSFPTGVSFRNVNGHLLTNTGVTNSNEVDPVTLAPVAMPFVYDDDLGAPYVGPTHAQIIDGHVLHHFVRHTQDNDGDQTYVVTSISPGSSKRDVIASIRKPTESSWSGKASFQHMTLATEKYYVMLESSCYVRIRSICRLHSSSLSSSITNVVLLVLRS